MTFTPRHLILIFLLITSLGFAQNPNGYYNSASGKKKDQLKTALHYIVRNHTVLDYGTLWLAFRETDQKDNGTVWDMYSNYIRTFSSYDLNREHSFPKSWWGGDVNAAYTDLNHIYPSDAVANEAKSNYPLGEVGNNPSFYNGVSTVGNNQFPGYTGVVFEPADTYKGDFARTYFYMVTCYQDYYNQWRYLYMIDANTYPVLKTWAVNLLLEWHRADPVSEKELNRNEAVFLLQNNRNPFIDYPQLAEHIWGNLMDADFIIDTSITEPVLVTPTNDTELQFGTVLKDHSRTLTLFVKGQNLTGNLSVLLFGTHRDQYAVNTTAIPAVLANTDQGYELEVTYSPTTISEAHTASLVIYDGGLTGSIEASLYARSIAEESITPPVALEASNISATGFRANWQVTPETDSYTLEIFAQQAGQTTLIQTIYDLESNYYDVTGLDEGIAYSYRVRRVVSEWITDPSELILVTTTTQIGKTNTKEHIQVWTNHRTIYIQNQSTAPERISIFDGSGRLLNVYTALTGLRTFPAPTGGIYLIDAGGDVRKIVVTQY